VNVYPFIAAEQAGKHSVKRACELLKVSRSAYYARNERSTRERVDEQLTVKIREVHAASNGTYGAPRIHAELADAGLRHGRKRIARRMRAAGIRGKSPRRWQVTTVADPSAAARPDLIGRDFTVDPARVDTPWCGDITYISTWEGWLYLATVIDLASRRVVGWAVADLEGSKILTSCVKGSRLVPPYWSRDAGAPQTPSRCRVISMAGYIQNCSTRGRLAIAADLTLGSSGADRDPAGRTPTRSIVSQHSAACRSAVQLS